MFKDSRVLYDAACTYGALKALKRLFAAGYSNPAWAADDTDLDCLYDDPEFQKLVAHDEKPAS